MNVLLETNDTTKPRYLQVASQLAKMLPQYQPGHKLPVRRMLMKHFSVSQATVDRSLQALEKQNLIKHIGGKGYFVNSHTRPLAAELCFFFRKGTLNNPLYGGIKSTMLTSMYEHEHKLQISVYEEMGSVESFKESFNEHINESPLDVFFTLACSKISFPQILNQSRIPVVHIYPNMHDENNVSYIIDSYSAIESALEVLFEAGHKRICFMHGQGVDGFYMLAQEERIEAFYDIMSRNQLSTAGLGVVYGGFSFEEGYKAAMKILSQSPRQRPSAIICNDYNVGGVMAAAQELGLVIPRDLSIIGFDKIPGIESLPIKLTTIDIQWEKMIQSIIESTTTVEKIKQLNPGIIRTPIKLIHGDTVARAPEASART
jgi:DNA-binding LacI/PurR family transcriptional regulator